MKKPALLIAIRGWDVERWTAEVRRRLPNRDIFATDDDSVLRDVPAALQDVRYALAWKPRPETLAGLGSLRVIFSLGAGVDHIFAVPDLPNVPVVRSISPDLGSRMAEYVAWQALDHLRRGRDYREQQRRHVWRELGQPAAGEVSVGLMGLGLMGEAGAAALLPLGFKVRGWSRRRKELAGVECYAGLKEFDRFLAGTDILVSLLPMTAETRHLIDLSVFKRLRLDGALGGPVFISAGRGGSQVEADIVAAIESGTLAAASLDVFEQEPLPPDNPLWSLPNVFITPHVAAVSDPRAIVAEIAAQIESFEAGKPLRNSVERERGY